MSPKAAMFARAVALVAIVAGVLVLAGWWFEIPVLRTGVPGLVSMKPNTALGLVMLGGAFLAQVARPSSLGARIFGALAIALGASTLYEVFTGVDLGIDELLLLHRPPEADPGRMGSLSAVNFILIGSCLVLPRRKAPDLFDPVWILSPLAVLSAWAGLVAYSYGVAEYPETPPVFAQPIAVHSGLIFMLLAAAVLAVRPDQIVVRMVTSNTPAGKLARITIPGALIFPAAAGLAVLRWSAAPSTSLELAMLLAALASVVFFSGLTLWAKTSLYRATLAREASETARRRSERRFRSFFQTVAVAGWSADPRGEFQADAHAWCEFTGQTLEQMKGSGWLDAVDPDDRDRVAGEWRAAVAHWQVFHSDFRLRKANGDFLFVSATAAPIHDDQGAVEEYVGLAADASARWKAERERAEFERQLARSNHDLEQFAAVAAHDLQEPLRKIQMFGAMLRDSAGPLNEESQQYLARMESAAQRGHELVRGLLSYSRLSTRAQQARAVDLTECAQEAVQELEAAVVREHAKVEIAKLPTVEGDPLLMRQLFQNLVGNAIKFHKPGAPPVVRVSAEASNGGWDISVTDDGIGFEEKYLDRIFKLFQRLNERGTYDGAGLGLAICKKIVERHGGTITARSAPGSGATFVFHLPARQRRAEGAAS